MLRILVFFCILCTATTLFAQGSSDKDIEMIKNAMQKQQDAWNNGDIDTFMEWYWKSDNLQFIGGNGPTFGWQNTLDNYKKRYPDTATMGKLKFDILQVDRRSRKVISLIGKFTLTREKDQPTGHFLLLWKKIKGQWLIIADCTSAASS